MNKPNKITLLFLFIFIVGVVGFVTYINKSLDRKSEVHPIYDQVPTRDTSVTFQE